jgi:hypothetical protein
MSTQAKQHEAATRAASYVVDGTVAPGTVLQTGAGTLTGVTITKGGVQTYPGYDLTAPEGSARVNSGNIQLSDGGKGRPLISIDASNGCATLTGLSLPFANGLVCDSVLTGGSCTVTTA